MADGGSHGFEERLQSWLHDHAGIEGRRRLVRAGPRHILISKFEEGFHENLESALALVPQVFDVSLVAEAVREEHAAGQGRVERWRQATERVLHQAEVSARIDARQRAEVMAGVDSVAALLETALWSEAGEPSAAERAAFADLKEALEGQGTLFTRHYGAFEGRDVVNHCPGAAHARRLLQVAWEVCSRMTDGFPAASAS